MVKSLGMFYKTLVIGVIILFFGISVQSVIAIVQREIVIESHSKLIGEPKLGTNKYPKKIEEYDDYKEIITLIDAEAHYDWKERRGILRGSIIIYICPWCRGADLFGLRRNNGKLEIYREYDIDYVNITHFIGIARVGVKGIAIGNIDWKELFPPVV